MSDLVTRAAAQARAAADALTVAMVQPLELSAAPVETPLVEVLRDGASAIYGTDAIGGVINFITKNNFQGLEVSAYDTHVEQGGGNAKSFNSCSHGAGRKMSRTAAMKAFTLADHEAATRGVEIGRASGMVLRERASDLLVPAWSF